jgi:serine protease Do
MAKPVVAQLQSKGTVTRGWIGVNIQTMTPELAKSFGIAETTRGALVNDVILASPAEKGGIKTADIIVSFNGKNVTNSSELSRFVAETPIGTESTLVVIRNGKKISLKVRVEELTEARLVPQEQTVGQNFGIKVGNITPQLQQQLGISVKSGVVVLSVERGSTASEAGIRPGDLIREVNRKPVKDIKEYNSAMAGRQEGQPLLLLVMRSQSSFFVIIKP